MGAVGEDTLSILQTKLDVSSDEGDLSNPINSHENLGEDTEDKEAWSRYEEMQLYFMEPSMPPVPRNNDIGDDSEDLDMEWPSAEMMQQSISAEEEAEQFASQFQRMIEESMGENGEEEVLPAGSKKSVCFDRGYYLHETFVHADYSKASYICRPCHAGCSRCTGPEKHDCLGEVNARPQRHRKATEAFMRSFSDVLKSPNSSTVALMDLHKEMDLHKQNQTNMKKKKCRLKSSKTINTTTTSKKVKAKLELAEEEFQGDVFDPADLKEEVQRAIEDENKRNGFIPGLTEEVDVSKVDGYLGGMPDFEVKNKDVKNIVQLEEDAQALIKDSCKKEMEEREAEEARDQASPRRREKSQAKWLAEQHRRRQPIRRRFPARRRMREEMINLGVAATRAKTYRRRRRRNTRRRRAVGDNEESAHNVELKEEVKKLMKGQGTCLDAMTKLTNLTQDAYDCYKDTYDNVKDLVCEPVEKHKILTKGLEAVMKSSKVIKLIATPLQYIPFAVISTPAKTVLKIAKRAEDILAPKVKALKAMRHHTHIVAVPIAQSDCCPPSVTDPTCFHAPGKLYRCGQCSSGIMCYAARACNTLTKLEDKANEWKQTHLDPLIETILEATENAQESPNLINSQSWMCKDCEIKTCDDVLKLVKVVEQKMKDAFLDDYCRKEPPTLNIPDFDPVLGALDFMIKIGDVFGNIKLALGKLHCLHVPMVEVWTERTCTRVCLPCCSWHGRRRWAGGMRCSSCCHSVCVALPRVRAYTKKFCFSALKILEGLGAIFQAVLGPVLAIIEKAIDFLLQPVYSLFDKILDMLGINVNWGLSPWPDFNFEFPSFPDLFVPDPKCEAVKAVIRR